jgi:hypothetical protein
MDHWGLIHEQAIKQKGKIFTSLVLHHKYKISEVTDKKVVIHRLTIGGTAIFGKTAFNRAAEKIRIEKRVKKAQSASGAIRQRTVVLLHPCIEWNSITKELFWVEKAMPSLASAINFVTQASDDELNKIQAWINRRKNQSAFKKAMMNLYEKKCVITGTSQKQVLEAAHIINHSKNGLNSNENGLLLRADIHKLFDQGLLQIHPDKLTVHLDKSLLNGEYGRYNDRRINMPIDGSRPSKKYLETRWKQT